MATPRVISLTERALLYTPVLDWVSPPNCEKLRITGVANSAIASALQAQAPSLIPVKTSYWHWGTKPIKAFARFLHTAAVMCLISPVGILYHGAYTVKHLSCYAIDTYSSDANAPADWEKTKQYAKAFFVEVTSFLLGTTLLSLGVGSAFLAVTLNDAAIVILSIPMILGIAHSFGSFTHESAIPMLLIPLRDERVGMYLSLALRNHLGFVNEEGGLLPFSSADKLEYTFIEIQREGERRNLMPSYSGRAYENLRLFCNKAESDLVDTIHELSRKWGTTPPQELQSQVSVHFATRNLSILRSQIMLLKGILYRAKLVARYSII